MTNTQNVSFWPKRHEVIEEPVVRIRNILRHTQKDFLTLIKKTSDAYDTQAIGLAPIEASETSLTPHAPPSHHHDQVTKVIAPSVTSVASRGPPANIYNRRRSTYSSVRAVARVLKGFKDTTGLLDMALVTSIIEDFDRCINQVNFIPREGLSTKVPTIKKTVNAMKLQRRLSKQDDAQVAGFLTELLNLGNEPRQQSSSITVEEAAAMVVEPITAMLDIYGILMPNAREINDALMEIDDWEFNIFKIKEMTEGIPLTCVTYHILQKRCMFDTFSISPRVMVNFLMKVEAKYNDVPYSNALHAADVVHNAHVLLGAANINPSEVEALSMLIACCVHAVDHPGLTNQYLIMTENPLAELYNNISVIQNNSCHQWLSVLTEKDCDILGAMHKAERTRVKLLVKDLVMATSMGQYVEILTDMQSIAEKKVEYSQEGNEQYEVRIRMLCALIHCCDIANPAKPLKMYLKWVEALKTEFFNQGDYELQRGLQISPMCDRTKVDFNECQIGLIDIVVLPIWLALASFCSPDLKKMMLYISNNRNELANAAPGVEIDRNTSRVVEELQCGEEDGRQLAAYSTELFSTWGRDEPTESSVNPGAEIISLLSSEIFADCNDNTYDTHNNSITDDDHTRSCMHSPASPPSHGASASCTASQAGQVDHAWTWDFAAL